MFLNRLSKILKRIEMDEKIKKQIIIIRDSGVTNMFDIPRVQKEAFSHSFYELVMYIENQKADYIHFIMYGEENNV